jgi:pSer/pThr/pTyr-binding forkhead associated (FHA) protein
MIVLSASRDGLHAGRVQAEEGRAVTIGRAQTNDLVLDGQGVSPEHCRIVHTGTTWTVEEIGGASGISVAGVRVSGSRPCCRRGDH